MRNLMNKDGFWEQLADYFAQFNLPAPQKDDIVHLRQEIAIPLNEYGCLFRITYAGEVLEKQGLSLEPIHEGEFRGNGPLSHIRIRLYAGVESVGVDRNDYRDLEHAFNRSGYALLATALDDCAYIPFEKNGKTIRLPLLIDVTDVRDNCSLDDKKESLRDALYRMANTCAEILRLKPSLKKELHQAQTVLYDPLRVKCQAMFDASPEDRNARTTEFWSAMRAATKETLPDGTKKLAAGWERPVKNFTGMRDEFFQARLEEALEDDAFAKPYHKKNQMSKGGDHYAIALRNDSFHQDILGPAEPPKPPAEKAKINIMPSGF